ncbi:DUF4393 domain-containing protein [Paraburkholderia sp. D1E]|uniref:DUF4393 domain-containing protein n=1 Tax=Paraburkholderia sp. D1E TaxID=3461398 RepID=UPI0040455C55
MSDDSDSGNAFDGVKSGMEVVGQVIKMAGKDAQVKEAASNLGKTAVTLTRAVNNALLPLAAINFGLEKARQYFTQRFELDLKETTKDIPEDQLIEPKASLAGPALQGLAFTHEEPDLKSMYLSLLATAMDKRRSDQAHPAFVEIIKQIDPSEITLLRTLLTVPAKQPIVELRHRQANGGGYMVMRRHYMNLTDDETGAESDLPKFPAMLENWIRLGLMEVDYAQFLVNVQAYSWVEQSELFKSLKASLKTDGSTVIFQRGLVGPTEFGSKFGSAVGMPSNLVVFQIPAADPSNSVVS